MAKYKNGIQSFLYVFLIFFVVGSMYFLLKNEAHKIVDVFFIGIIAGVLNALFKTFSSKS